MVAIVDAVYDAALQYIEDNAGAIHICSQEPTTYTEATSTYTLGNKATPTITGPVNGDTNGRKTTVDAITDGSVTGTGTASHWALVKTSATTSILATGALTSSQAVTSGNTFSLTAIDIEIADPT